MSDNGCTCGRKDYDGPGATFIGHGPGCPAPYRPRGWTHEEAKKHTVMDRLLERCSVYAQDFMACPDRPDLSLENWCERCLAAVALTKVTGLHHRRPHTANGGKRAFGFDFVTHGQTEFPDLCDHCSTPWPCPTAAALEPELVVRG